MPALTCPACGHIFAASASQTTTAPSCERCGRPCPLPATPTVRPETLRPAPPASAARRASSPASAPPNLSSPPGYEILGELGRGGMGVVYKARQVSLNRIVALKMILAGDHAGAIEVARFRAEAEALARLQHPNIVQVHEVGEAEAGPYFSLELVEGGGLDKKLNGTPRKSRVSAQLVEVLARAIHAAHERGVVHRDLKPANVLFTQDGVVKITDFGLAKRLDERGQTHTAVAGTPSYMAPEQAAGRGKEVSPATDVYALGAILYECLTGRPPFKAATTYDTLMQVMGDEPVPVRRLQSNVPPDLETICLKCLRKEPARRYASAADLADDLERFQAGEPIRARPVGVGERALKWVRRRPAIAGLLLGLVVVSVLGLAGVTAALLYALEGWGQADGQRRRADSERKAAEEKERQAQRARTDAEEKKQEADRASREARREKRAALKQKGEADQARETAVKTAGHLSRALARAEGLLHANRMALADREAGAGNHTQAQEVLAECASTQRGWEWHHLYRRTRCGTALLTLAGHDSKVTSVAYSPDGSRLASASFDKTVKVWDARTGANLLSLKGHTSGVLGVAYSPDGSRLATAGQDKTVKLWDARTGKESLTFAGHTNAVSSVAYSPDGSRLASASADKTVKLWDARTGKELLTLAGHTNTVVSVAYGPDGSRIASAGMDRTVKVWDARTGACLLTLAGHTDRITSVAYSPDGARLASASWDQTVKVWDARTGANLLTFKGHTSGAWTVCFSPDGSRIASSGFDTTVKLWDAHSGADLLTLKWHGVIVESVAFSPDGSRLAAGGIDKTMKVWDVRAGTDRLSLTGHTGFVYRVAFSPDGSRLASASADKTVKLWDARTGANLLTLRGHTSPVASVAYSPDGSCLASASVDTVKMWDARTGADLLTLRRGGKGIARVCFSPDGSRLAGISGNTVNVWDARTGAGLFTLVGHTGSVTSVAYSTDGSHLVSASFDKTVKLWDARTGKELRTLAGNADSVRGVCFSPDGSCLANPSADGTVKVWDARIGANLLILAGHTALVTDVCFSPDGSRLASTSLDKTVRVWDARSGGDLLVLEGHTSPVHSIAFSLDGRRVFARSAPQRRGEQGRLLAWDTSTGTRVDPSAPPPRPVGQLFDPREPPPRRPPLPANQRFAAHPASQRTAWASGPFVFLRSATSASPAARARRAEDDIFDTVVWRRQQARAAEEAGNWFAATFHLDYLRHLQPGPASPGPARTRLVAAALQRNGKDVPALLARARLALDAGDLAGYRLTCAALPEGPTEPHAHAIAWACCLAPKARADLGPLLQAAAKGPAALRIHAALLLRTGRHADALKRLDQSLKARGPHATPVEELLLAIAYHHLGHEADAQRWLARARAWLDVPGKAPMAVPSLGRELLFGWQAWLDVQLLRREAEALVAPRKARG